MFEKGNIVSNLISKQDAEYIFDEISAMAKCILEKSNCPYEIYADKNRFIYDDTTSPVGWHFDLMYDESKQAIVVEYGFCQIGYERKILGKNDIDEITKLLDCIQI